MNISTIIPAYNCEKTLELAVESVLAQTRPVDEIVIVNDGSTDNTGKICDRLSDSSGKPVIRVIHQPNSGPSAARNAGITQATGELIAFLDADDIWMPDKIAKQAEVYEHTPTLGLTCAGVYSVMEEGPQEGVSICRGGMVGDDPYLDLWEKPSYIGTSTVMTRKSILQEVGLFDENEAIIGAEDYDLWLRVLASHNSLVYLNEPLVRYRVSMSGFNRSNLARAYGSQINIIRKYEAQLEDRYGAAARRLIVNKSFRVYYQYARNLLANGRAAESRRQFINALRYKPFDARVWVDFMVSLLGDRLIRILRSIKRRLVS